MNIYTGKSLNKGCRIELPLLLLYVRVSTSSPTPGPSSRTKCIDLTAAAAASGIQVSKTTEATPPFNTIPTGYRDCFSLK